MNITFYNKDGTKSFSIHPSQHYNKKGTHVWVTNENGEGGQFNADDVCSVIYDAIDKYFKENY